MEITTRRTHGFIEIKVDEIKTTIFKSNQKKIDDTINNLLDVIDDLLSYTDKSIKDYIQN